jgi:hypothetical protein
MKKGQIILGATAFIVTAASVLAFRAHNKSTQNRIYGQTDVNNPNSCTVTTCFTNVNGGSAQKCHTVSNQARTVFTKPGGGVTWWLGKTAAEQQCFGFYHGNWTHNS